MMKKMHKTRVNAAIAAVLSAACLVPATSFGITIDVGTPGTAPAIVKASGAGDTLLFPFYTTVNGASTSFSVTNTSNTTVAAKIRFREQERSTDVLDFIAVLSPFDKFDFTVSKPTGSQRPVMAWNDNTCLIGPPPGAKSVGFPPARFPATVTLASTDKNRGDAGMAVGHAEVIAMADLSTAY
jgi:hypothetical protein